MTPELYYKSFHNSPISKSISKYEDGTYIEVNESFTKLVGYTREEMVGKKSTELNLFTKKGRAEVIRKIEEDGYVKNVELSFYNKNNDIIYGLFSSDVLYVENEKYLLSVFIDMTTEKKLQKEILESEIKFRSIFNKSPIGIILYDDNGELKEMNNSAINIFGIKNIDDIKYLNLFHQPNKEEIKKTLDENNYWEGEIDFDFDKFKKNGNFKSINSGLLKLKISVVKYNFNGSSYMVMLQDVTKYHDKLNEIKTNEEKFKSLFYKSPIGIELYDENGLLQEANNECLEIFGTERSELLKKFNLFKDPNLPYNIKEILEKKDKWESIITFDFNKVTESNLYSTKKTGIIYLNVIITKLKSPSDLKYIAQIQDITEYELNTRKLEELVQTKNKLFSIISHDLKSPFSSILGFTDLLYDDYHNYSDEEKLKHVKNIKASATNAFNLLQNLLDWSVTQSKMEFESKYLDMSSIIIDVIKTYKTNATLKKIKLFTHINYKTECYGNEETLKIVLRNLIGNAIKFTNRNGRIYINNEYIIKNDIEYLKICVCDNGIGIDKDLIEKLFKVGEKVRKMGTEQEMGTGLGLIICKELIIKNGGDIWVESKKGKGSKFYFTIPRKKPTLN